MNLEGVLVSGGRLPRKWWPAGGNGLGFIAGNDWHILISKMLLTHFTFLNVIIGQIYNILIHIKAVWAKPLSSHWVDFYILLPYICLISRHLRKSSIQAGKTRTAAQLLQPSMSVMSGRTTASYRVSTQVPQPHEYQEDTLSLSLVEKHVTRSGKKYSDILIEKYV